MMQFAMRIRTAERCLIDRHSSRCDCFLLDGNSRCDSFHETGVVYRVVDASVKRCMKYGA